MKTEPVIQLRDINNRFDHNLVHQGLSLEVYRGEILGIIGVSGSGKSVLLRTMALLHRPFSGEVHIFGHDALSLGLEEEKRMRLKLGFMFQNGALFSSLTVFENVRFPLDEHTRLTQRIKSEVVMLKIHLTGLETEAAAKYPRELSGGMVKRAALARTLVLDPAVLFLDEPTSGLDPVTASTFDTLVAELKNMLDLTVVMVTHDLDTLWNTTDRVAFLADRRIVAVAPIQELINHPHPAIMSYFSGRRRHPAKERAWKAK